MISIAKKAQKYFWMLALSMMILPFAPAADTTTKPQPANINQTDTNKADSKPAVAVQESVNINTADEKTLAQALEGIGKKKAKAIVDYRKKNGLFKNPADVMKVKGIGKKTFAKNKDKIRVSDEETDKPVISTSSQQPQTRPAPQVQGKTEAAAKDSSKKTQGCAKNKDDK